MNAPVRLSFDGYAINPTKFFSICEEARGMTDADILNNLLCSDRPQLHPPSSSPTIVKKWQGIWASEVAHIP